MIVASPESFRGWEQVQSRIRPVGHGLILTSDDMQLDAYLGI